MQIFAHIYHRHSYALIVHRSTLFQRPHCLRFARCSCCTSRYEKVQDYFRLLCESEKLGIDWPMSGCWIKAYLWWLQLPTCNNLASETLFVPPIRFKSRLVGSIRSRNAHSGQHSRRIHSSSMPSHNKAHAAYCMLCGKIALSAPRPDYIRFVAMTIIQLKIHHISNVTTIHKQILKWLYFSHNWCISSLYDKFNFAVFFTEDFTTFPCIICNSVSKPIIIDKITN